MRSLITMAVLGVVCSTLSHQAYGSYQSYSHGVHHQPRWTGPLASSVPAGIGGRVTPVSDTYEVAAARDAFFNAYDRQLSAVGGHRAPSYHGGAVHHGASSSFSHGGGVYHGASSSHGGASYGGAPIRYGQVQDTPAVAAAKAQFFDLYNKQAAAAAAAPDDYVSYRGW